MRWSPRGRTIFSTSSPELDSDQVATPAESSAQSFEGHSSQDILMVSCCYCSSQEWTHPKNPLHICTHKSSNQNWVRQAQHYIIPWILYTANFVSECSTIGWLCPSGGSRDNIVMHPEKWAKVGYPYIFQSRLWSPL
jgi:hypothetical protein